MDVLFIDGLDSIIIFSLGIISRSTDTMMNTDLETLLEFLKGDIIKPYVDDLTLLIKDYMTFYPHIHRLNKYAKEHQKKPTYMHSGGDVVNDMQVELNITKSALESIKKDLCSVNTDYMDLSKKYETVCNELERANYRAKAAEKKLNTVLDSICSSDNSHVEVGEDMMYAELLIKKNIDIASENLHLKEKLDILTKKIDSITSESNLKRNDN